MSSAKRVLVLGAGAIGGYVGGSLSRSGIETVFLCREATGRRIRNDGLLLELPGQTVRAEPAVALSAAEAFSNGKYDLLIVAVKRYDTVQAVQPLHAFVDKIGWVLCLQNGVGAEEALIELLGTEKVLAGTVTTAVGRPAPNRIAVERFRGVGIAGTDKAAREWAQIFSEAGLNCRSYPDGKALKWSKLITNLIANPTSAILDMPPSEIFSHPGLFRLEIRQLREALAVMRKLGANVVDLPGTPVRLLAFCARFLPLPVARLLLGRALGSGRGGKMPSFHGDLHGGAGRSEVDVLHGEVVRAGKALGVKTPVNALLYDTLRSLLHGEQDLERFRHNPTRLLGLQG